MQATLMVILKIFSGKGRQQFLHPSAGSGAQILPLKFLNLGL